MKSLVLCICILAVTGRVTAQHNTIDDFKWLTGTWQMKTPKGILYESWIAESDTIFAGNSIKVKLDGDTVILEHVKIICNDRGCAYVPIAVGQNDDKPVVFRMTSITKSGFVAENPAHDFPKVIRYNRDQNQLNASVSGSGKENKFAFVLLK